MKKIAIFSVLMLMLTSTLSYGVLANDPDVEAPSDVEGFAATALSEGVKLTWLPATDNVGVAGYEIHYGLTPALEQGEVYDEIVDVGNVLQYTVSGLTNGTTYYFSAIAYDAAGNESVNWAVGSPLSATPDVNAGASTNNSEAPQVSDAEAVNKTNVKVEFSKKIVLPEEDPQDSFSIENNEDFTELVVLAAEMDEDDETGKTVLLTTEEQEEGTEYTLVANISIKDEAGNPIISGTSDTAVFVGSGLDPEDEPALVVVKAMSIDNEHVSVEFNKTVVLDIDPLSGFEIYAEDDPTETLTTSSIMLGENEAGVDDAFALIKTSPQENKIYVVKVTGVTDEDGNLIHSESNVATFLGKSAADTDDPSIPLPDLTPPADVASFLAKKVLQENKYLVTLSWVLPGDADWDSVLQNLYMSMDKGDNYTKKASLETDVTEYEVGELEPGEYWFKLTQEDAAGNESEGVVTKILLAETGPAGLVGLVLLSLGLGKLVTKRRS
jgi:hypothetical protein